MIREFSSRREKAKFIAQDKERHLETKKGDKISPFN
jgi:hypothetical protein